MTPVFKPLSQLKVLFFSVAASFVKELLLLWPGRSCGRTLFRTEVLGEVVAETFVWGFGHKFTYSSSLLAGTGLTQLKLSFCVDLAVRVPSFILLDCLSRGVESATALF